MILVQRTALTRLALSSVRERRGGVIGTFVALFCAAALVGGCGMLLATGIAGTFAPERYAATPVLVTADQDVHIVTKDKDGDQDVDDEPFTDRAWLPATVADRLRALPGVGSVVPEVTFAAYLPGGRTDESWGHGWDSAPLGGFTLAAGRAPQAPDEVVLDAAGAAALHLRVGSMVNVLTSAGSLPCRVVGVTAQGTSDETELFFTAEQARTLAGHPGLLSAIGVFPRPGTAPGAADALSARVRAALAGTGAIVSTGDARGPAEFLGADTARVDLISIGAVLGGTSLLVALLVVTGTSSLSVQQRQRELAVLRAVAATPKQIRKLIGTEALLVGGCASAAGAAAGIPMGSLLLERFTSLGIAPANLRPAHTPLPALIAAAATLLAAWGAARVSARRATRIRPTEALSEAELTPPGISKIRILFGLLAVAGAITLTCLLPILHEDAASAPVSIVATLLWCAALGLLGPLISRAAVAVAALAAGRVSRVGGFLAGANLRAGSHRLASVLTPLALLVAMACTILFSHTTMDRAAAAQQSAATHADYVVGPRVPTDVVGAVRAVPGVRAVTEVLHARVLTGQIDRPITAVTPDGLAEDLDPGVEAGSMASLSPGTLAVASGLGYRMGDRVTLRLPDGTQVTLGVVALYRRSLAFGQLILDRDLLAAHVDVPLDDELLVRAPGLSRAALAAALAREPSVAVASRDFSVASENTTVSTQVGYISLALILAFTAIALCNTLAMTISHRSRELHLLRLVGATRRQVLGMLRWETAITVLLGTGIGTAIAAAVLSAYADGMTATASPSIPMHDFAAIIATATALAALAGWLPARAVLRRR